VPRSSRIPAPDADRLTTGQPGALAFIVEGNPIPKARSRVVNGHSYTPGATRAAEARITHAARQAGARPRSDPVSVTMRFFRGDARRCDLDNLAKTVLDALNRVAFLDDSQVVQVYAWKAIDREHPRTEVEVKAVPDMVQFATVWGKP